jgi:hypothetical protein
VEKNVQSVEILQKQTGAKSGRGKKKNKTTASAKKEEIPEWTILAKMGSASR